MRRLSISLLWTLGWICVGLGTAGLLLPLLPTTPFLLVASWCFDRSSPRLHAWLLGTPVLGSLLRDWRVHGSIRPRAKVACTALLLVFWAMAWMRETTPVWALVAMAAVSAVPLLFVWTRPSAPRSQGSATPAVADPGAAKAAPISLPS